LRIALRSVRSPGPFIATPASSFGFRSGLVVSILRFLDFLVSRLLCRFIAFCLGFPLVRLGFFEGGFRLANFTLLRRFVDSWGGWVGWVGWCQLKTEQKWRI